jgi:nicotinamidase-related amidase
MNDGLLVVDVFNDFDHKDGDALLASFHERVPAMVEAIMAARAAEIRARPGGEVIPPLTPARSDRFVLKSRYSALDHTALVLLLQELQIERIVLIGSAVEGCVVQTGIDAREAGFKVTIWPTPARQMTLG